jgi:lipopolysaccharide/colanic/teichoic acid biosynthesis glycosyltransferase
MTALSAVKAEDRLDWMVRATDVLLSASLTIIVAPVLGLLCLVIWLHDGANPVFVHWSAVSVP